jgi:hypothetical protein
VVHKNSVHAMERWELRGGKRAFGRPVRRYFSTKSAATKKARELAEEFRAHGSRATDLSDTQRADAVKAFNLLGERSGSLLAAVEFFVKHGPKKNSLDVETAVFRFLETRGVSRAEFDNPRKHREPEARQRRYKGYSWKHRVDLVHRMRPFVKKWGSDPVSVLALKRTEIQTWLQETCKSPTTIDNHRRTIHSFFCWAASQNLASDNPAKRWHELSTLLKDAKKRKRPGILTVEALGSLLKFARAGDPEILPCLVIGAFSGIRTEELAGLTWGLIGPDMIHVPSWLSKTGEERDIRLHPTLKKWLNVIPRREDNARVLPGDFGKRRRQLCIALKLKWPSNALRHSFGSYRYADTEDIAATAFEMRHEDPQTFRQHYLNRGISKETARKYWELSPDSPACAAMDPPKNLTQPKGATIGAMTKKQKPSKDPPV